MAGFGIQLFKLEPNGAPAAQHESAAAADPNGLPYAQPK